MRHLGIADWQDIADSDACELAAVLTQRQAWETTDDPDGRQLPRAQCHDDKSLAVVTTRLSQDSSPTGGRSRLRQ
jgi:hypothetical protein